MQPRIDQPMRYRIQPQIDQPKRLLIQFDSTQSNDYLCDSELTFDSTQSNYYLCDSELNLIQPMVMITYGCIQEMECNLGLSEVLGYPTRELFTPAREMFA